MEQRGATASPRRSWTPLLAAAVVVVAMAGLWVVLRPAPVKIPPEFRAGASDEIRSLTDESVPLARSAAILEWTGPEGATYTIRVATEDLNPVAGGYGLSEGRFTVPESALEALPSETILVWQVEAHLEGGGLISSRSFLSRIE